MDCLYKYLPAKRLDVLQNLKIRYSPFGSLNDPFESSPNLLAGEDINTEFDAILKEFDQNFMKEIVDEYSYALVSDARIDIIRDMEAIKSDLPQGLMDYLGDSYGVLSLSRTRDSLLMWSHYAESCTGFVLGFKRTHPFLNKSTLSGTAVGPKPVIYSTVRAEFTSGCSYGPEHLFLKKPLEWAYEEEERIFLGLMDEDQWNGSIDDFGNKVILQSIPKDAIAEVCIGPKASNETIKGICDAVVSNGLSCNVYRVLMARNEFKLQFEKVMCTLN